MVNGPLNRIIILAKAHAVIIEVGFTYLMAVPRVRRYVPLNEVHYSD